MRGSPSVFCSHKGRKSRRCYGRTASSSSEKRLDRQARSKRAPTSLCSQPSFKGPKGQEKGQARARIEHLFRFVFPRGCLQRGCPMPRHLLRPRLYPRRQKSATSLAALCEAHRKRLLRLQKGQRPLWLQGGQRLLQRLLGQLQQRCLCQPPLWPRFLLLLRLLRLLLLLPLSPMHPLLIPASSSSACVPPPTRMCRAKRVSRASSPPMRSLSACVNELVYNSYNLIPHRQFPLAPLAPAPFDPLNRP